MLLRLIFIFILGCLFFVLLNLIFSWLKQRLNARYRNHLKSPEEMVLDPECQSYLPKGEAIFRDGHYFCSEECARVYLSR